MSARIEWDGWDEFIRDLKRLPDDLQEDGRKILTEEVLGAREEITAQYNRVRKTGTLANRVQAQFPSSTVLVGIVQSTAPHSHLYAFGTKVRQTLSGANRGRMPAAAPEVFVTTVRRRRDRMVRRMVELVRRAGFQVNG